MPDSESLSSSLRTAWQYVKRHWQWPVLILVGLYAYQQYMPSIDLRDEGRPAPSFAAETIDGDTFRLREHRGQVVVVNVWATWCPPCRVEMPGFVDLQRRFRDDGVRFVGVSVDREGTGVVQSFVEEEGINFPQIVAPALATRHFPGEVVPRTYLIDKDGHIRYTHSGVLLKWALDDALETLVAEPAVRSPASRDGGTGADASRWSSAPTTPCLRPSCDSGPVGPPGSVPVRPARLSGPGSWAPWPASPPSAGPARVPTAADPDGYEPPSRPTSVLPQAQGRLGTVRSVVLRL
jgi:peroxiredoxin